MGAPWRLAKGGSEDAHQMALFAWANMAGVHGFDAAWDAESYKSQANALRYGVDPRRPSSALLAMFAIPNGGQRHKAVAAKMKATGTKRGVPDIFLPQPIDRWHGLFVELKKPGGKPSDEQVDWNRVLTVKGYRVYLCEGWEHAARSLQFYLEGNDVYEQR